MYDVGFGDCFLVFLPTPNGIRKMLVDCGTIKKGSKDLTKVIASVIKTLAEKEPDGRPRVDLLVATHRHRDHIGGFANDLWDEVEVGEIWMPWTESPFDFVAADLRASQLRLANGIRRFLAAHEQSTRLSTDEMAIDLMLDNAMPNAQALERLHTGFPACKSTLRRYLPETINTAAIVSDRLPGVSIHVLGPSRDPESIKDLNPPIGERFLQLNSATDQSDAIFGGFHDQWRLKKRQVAARYGRSIDEMLTEAECSEIRSVLDQMVPGTVAALDAAINGSSLVLLIEVQNACLLFPGDAQWGTWQRMLAHRETTQLLGKTTFYKVGHHGSGNGTPLTFVKFFMQKTSARHNPLQAMCSVAEMKQWPGLPNGRLLAALNSEANSLVRSDRPQESGPTFQVFDGFIEAKIPTNIFANHLDGE